MRDIEFADCDWQAESSWSGAAWVEPEYAVHELVLRFVGVAEDYSSTSFLDWIQSQLGTIMREAELCFAHFDDERFGYGLTPFVGIDIAADSDNRGDRSKCRQDVL